MAGAESVAEVVVAVIDVVVIVSTAVSAPAAAVAASDGGATLPPLHMKPHVLAQFCNMYPKK